jgi:hypothetical protein
MSAGTNIQFLFESSENDKYVDVLADSELVSGSIVSQNAGSSDRGIYYQVGGGGLNGEFETALGGQVANVNAELRKAYDAEFGAGLYDKHSSDPLSLPPLDSPPLGSVLVPVSPGPQVGTRVIGMVYSVGPKLDPSGAGLTAEIIPAYTRIYLDAMTRIALSPTKVDGFRITMLSSGIYRGNAPIPKFAEAAADCIITAVRTGIKAHPAALKGLAILINTNRTAEIPMELAAGFTEAAKALGVEVTSSGFSIPVF